MSATETAPNYAANLEQTYVRLALATQGALMWEEGKLRGCAGTFNHPVCNFAIADSVSVPEANRLKLMAAARKVFHVYLLPGQDEEVSDETLRRSGFKALYSLVQMSGEAVPWSMPAELATAGTAEERGLVAKFMSDQFFARQHRVFRDGIAMATANAMDLELAFLGTAQSLTGALMLCRMNGSLGIYNLCVEPRSRGQGWGRAMVGWALTVAAAEDLTPTLQCDPKLVSWYQDQGFQEAGIIRAYALDPAFLFDTM